MLDDETLDQLKTLNPDGSGYAAVGFRMYDDVDASTKSHGAHAGTAIATEFMSRVKAGTNGCIIGVWHDGTRRRWAVGYVGENGINADTWYTCTNGQFVEAPFSPRIPHKWN